MPSPWVSDAKAVTVALSGFASPYDPHDHTSILLLPSYLLRLPGRLVVRISRSQLGCEIRDQKKHLVSSSAKVKGIIASIGRDKMYQSTYQRPMKPMKAMKAMIFAPANIKSSPILSLHNFILDCLLGTSAWDMHLSSTPMISAPAHIKSSPISSPHHFILDCLLGTIASDMHLSSTPMTYEIIYVSESSHTRARARASTARLSNGACSWHHCRAQQS